MTASPEHLEGTVDPKLLEILVCPLTKGPLEYDAAKQELISRSAKLAYPIRDGIPIMLPEEARRLSGQWCCSVPHPNARDIVTASEAIRKQRRVGLLRFYDPRSNGIADLIQNTCERICRGTQMRTGASATAGSNRSARR